VLKQPALLAESRAAAQELAAQLRSQFSTRSIGMADVNRIDFVVVATELLETLRQIG